MMKNMKITHSDVEKKYQNYINLFTVKKPY